MSSSYSDLLWRDSLQAFDQVGRLTRMNNETHRDLARILAFAATYLEERGRARFTFGGKAGQPLCPAAAIALALGFNPRRIGRGWFFSIPNEVHRSVGTVILRTGLLNKLPVPENPYGRRKLRPAGMSPYRAVKELARWSDDKTLDTLVIGAVRQRASELLTGAGTPGKGIGVTVLLAR